MLKSENGKLNGTSAASGRLRHYYGSLKIAVELAMGGGNECARKMGKCENLKSRKENSTRLTAKQTKCK